MVINWSTLINSIWLDSQPIANLLVFALFESYRKPFIKILIIELTANSMVANNAYRFYIAIGVWSFQDIQRLESLDECLDIALAQERFELCARIKAVRED